MKLTHLPLPLLSLMHQLDRILTVRQRKAGVASWRSLKGSMMVRSPKLLRDYSRFDILS